MLIQVIVIQYNTRQLRIDTIEMFYRGMRPVVLVKLKEIKYMILNVNSRQCLNV